MPGKLVLALATAVGVIVANLYYAQPLVAMISTSIGLRQELAGLVVTLTQIGYGVGVLFFVPLGDIVESKKLMLTMICVSILGLLGLAFASSVIPYFLAAFATGVGASTVQMIIPYAASMVPEHKRGAIVGTLASGLMMGIMLSRPVSGIMTDLFSWHSIFVLSSVLMLLTAFMLFNVLPKREPGIKNLRYAELLKSMGNIFLTTPLLRRRGFYQAMLFGAFCLFWTASPLFLAGPVYKLSPTAIAMFALVGVVGAVAAPFAGKAADKGYVRLATIAGISSTGISFGFGHIFPAGSALNLTAFVFSAILLDAGVTANLIMGQREIFSLAPELRSRLNGLFVAMVFVGGATGSALGAWAYARGGWVLTSWVGFTMPLIALVFFLTEGKLSSPRSHSELRLKT